MARGRPKKVKTVEVRGFLIQRCNNVVTDQQLFALHQAFHKRLKMIQSPTGDVFIYTFDDQLFWRLWAMLPLMPMLQEQVLKVPQEKWCELKLEEALGNALR